jgi:hypothetical protein
VEPSRELGEEIKAIREDAAVSPTLSRRSKYGRITKTR